MSAQIAIAGVWSIRDLILKPNLLLVVFFISIYVLFRGLFTLLIKTLTDFRPGNFHFGAFCTASTNAIIASLSTIDFGICVMLSKTPKALLQASSGVFEVPVTHLVTLKINFTSNINKLYFSTGISSFFLPLIVFFSLT